jgi:NitT/TauT family transport system permease protein
LMLLGWEALERALEVRPEIVPTPSRIALEFWRSGALLRSHAIVTCEEILNGFSLAVFAGAILGVCLGCSAAAYRVTGPGVGFVARFPLVIFAPLLFVWFGYGSSPEVLLIFLLCLFPVAHGTMRGMQEMPRELKDLLRITGASRVRSFLKIRMPISLPMLFRGLSAAAALAIVGAVVGDFLGGDRGLGYLMMASMARMNTPLVFAALTAVALIWAALDAAVWLCRRILVPVPSDIVHFDK